MLQPLKFMPHLYTCSLQIHKTKLWQRSLIDRSPCLAFKINFKKKFFSKAAFHKPAVWFTDMVLLDKQATQWN